jgi:hypothetical protein
VLVGTPGSVDIRTVRGSSFYYRQFYDALGRKRAEYIGPVGNASAEARARSTRTPAVSPPASDIVRADRRGPIRSVSSFLGVFSCVFMVISVAAS